MSKQEFVPYVRRESSTGCPFVIKGVRTVLRVVKIFPQVERDERGGFVMDLRDRCDA